MFPAKTDKKFFNKLIHAIEHTGLEVSNLNANTANGYYSPIPPENVFEPSLCNADAELRQWRQNFSIETIKLAAELGAKNISITSGHPQSGILPESSLDLFVDSLKRICDAAAKYNINVGIEYEPGLLVERATELLEVMERVNSPHLGANLDIGHSYLNGEPIERTITSLTGRIWNVHVEDIKNRKHFHLVPGEGDLPFARYFQTLKSINYQGFLTVELYTYPNTPVEAGKQSLQYLRTILDSL